MTGFDIVWYEKRSNSTEVFLLSFSYIHVILMFVGTNCCRVLIDSVIRRILIMLDEHLQDVPLIL